MKNHHKYFRNLRYKSKLESKVGSNRTYYSHVYFITKEVDPRNIRENVYKYQSHGMSLSYVIEYLSRPDRGKNYHVYYDRPEVDYSIVEYYTPPRRSKLNSYYKKYSNKIIRQEFKQTGNSYNNCTYKKQFDIKWTID